MQAPAAAQLGPQGGDPLPPLLPVGPDPLAQQAAQSGQDAPDQQQHLHRQPLGLREPLGLLLPHQPPPVASGLLCLFCQALAAGHHRADLALAVLPGAHGPPQAPAGAPILRFTRRGRLLPFRDQGLYRRRGRLLFQRLPAPALVRLLGGQALASTAGLLCRMMIVSHMLAHIVSVKASQNSYNLLPFVIIRYFPLPVKSKFVKKVPLFLVFLPFFIPQHLVESRTFDRRRCENPVKFCNDICNF